MKKCLLFFLIVLVSCSSHPYQEEENLLADFLGGTDYLKTHKAIIVIPVIGCGPCIKQMNEFAHVAYAKKELLFIYCDVKGQRVQHLFRNNANALKFLKIDETCELQSGGIVEAKPAVYYLKNGQISGHTAVDEGNATGVIAKLKMM